MERVNLEKREGNPGVCCRAGYSCGPLQLSPVRVSLRSRAGCQGCLLRQCPHARRRGILSHWFPSPIAEASPRSVNSLRVPPSGSTHTQLAGCSNGQSRKESGEDVDRHRIHLVRAPEREPHGAHPFSRAQASSPQTDGLSSGPDSWSQSASAGKPAWIPSKEELGVILLRILNGIHHMSPFRGNVLSKVSGEDVEGFQCGRSIFCILTLCKSRRHSSKTNLSTSISWK